MSDNKLLLVTTAVDPQFQLYAFPSYLKYYSKKPQISLKVCVVILTRQAK